MLRFLSVLYPKKANYFARIVKFQKFYLYKLFLALNHVTTAFQVGSSLVVATKRFLAD
jgi:hypothetical protein